MAPPSPENDHSPKAPDKKTTDETSKENDKDTKTLSNLNELELKALLDEAINYKNPKDKEGKSKLFKNLLSKAVEDERKNRATSAGGSELVRYYNTTAARRHGGRHGRRKPSASVSENVMHGGSLDNLAKEELYEAERRHRTRRNVSARMREGGSLPCNVNSSMAPAQGYQFLEEARRSKKDKEFTAIDMESVSLLENDSLAQNYQTEAPAHESAQALGTGAPAPGVGSALVELPKKYTTKASLQVSNVDDPIQLSDLDGNSEKKNYDLDTIQSNVLHSKYSVYFPTYKLDDSKKVDENGNALQQTKTKKKKAQSDKNVVVLASENVEGHRGDIINDIPKLVEFIGGGDALPKKSNLHKSKQLHKQHTADEATVKGGKKQRAHSTKGKESRGELKKSNSLGEISTANLEDFEFDAAENSDVGKVVLRAAKNGGGSDRPRERRSWGTVEPPPFPALSANTSAEHLESSESWIETKTKKKSKRRRNSASSSGGGGRRRAADRGPGSDAGGGNRSRTRRLSPEAGGKACASVPHSEKSNDSSDVDSVHSLPIDGLNAPISYADIAKNSEKLKDKKLTPEKSNQNQQQQQNHPPSTGGGGSPAEKQVPNHPHHHQNSIATIYTQQQQNNSNVNRSPQAPAPKTQTENHHHPAEEQPPVKTTAAKILPVIVMGAANGAAAAAPAPKNPPPDVTNFKSFPAICGKGAAAPANGPAPAGAARLPVAGGQTLASKVRNGPSPSNGKVKAAAAGKVGGGISAGAATIAQVAAQVSRQNDVNIQNDLSIIQANEKENIQFNASRLPPNIPDVQSIEKHFLSNAAQEHHQRNNHHNNLNNLNNQDKSPSSSSTSTSSVSQDAAIGYDVDAALANGVCDAPARGRRDVDAEEGERLGEEEGEPAVVILSGSNNKEVPGLVFGFDINEQLLSEDVCENFVARYAFPKTCDAQHDKIVNFIGLAWESVVNTNEKVSYYVEGL
ncbi:unnamed protein product [Brassicogethes aeneus]|uniref:Uncharacterized protein n=1 Tax=Brassicogethes aeneus TaxID=1431903 RepID=A0A9P0AX95_BRAAE|nr:unnamed protein product [Brassicogethes aeneus]